MSRLLNLIHLDPEEKAKRGLIHTPNEIAQQPHTWATSFMNFQQRRPEIQSYLQSKGVGPDTAKTIPRPIVFLIGAGTSDYIGQSLIALLRQKWQCEVNAVPSTDLLTNFDDFILRDTNYLWISFSRSGDSPEGVNVLDKALKEYPNISHVVVSCNAQGKMIRDHQDDPRVLRLLLDDAVNDRGLAMTSSFSNMVICGQCLAHTWTLEEYEPILQSLIAAGEKFLDVASECAATLSEGPYTRVCFVGSGSLKAVATESALKVSELTAGRIQSMSESTLGLRHGPLAALNAETLFVSFISSDSRRQRYEADLLGEIGNKGVVQTRVAVALQPSKEVEKECEHFLTPGLRVSIPDPYRPPLDVIFGQLLGLFFSIHCNLKPDVPSPSGAITRVVQNVPIH
ncbi:MAG TPA: tagatose-6-phosphate ketose isomerase [Acidobacteriaceae bacterium]|nr:tagatose-6-phosphate ketose isomerase [Acidobacteriaceae bacterium]